jgi:hypothetical protein
MGEYHNLEGPLIEPTARSWKSMKCYCKNEDFIKCQISQSLELIKSCDNRDSEVEVICNHKKSVGVTLSSSMSSMSHSIPWWRIKLTALEYGSLDTQGGTETWQFNNSSDERKDARRTDVFKVTVKPGTILSIYQMIGHCKPNNGEETVFRTNAFKFVTERSWKSWETWKWMFIYAAGALVTTGVAIGFSLFWCRNRKMSGMCRCCQSDDSSTHLLNDESIPHDSREI